MYYYEILVGDLQFHGKAALTYASEQALLPGSVVRIALRSRSVLGIVTTEVPEPSFAAKPIAAIARIPPLPATTLPLIHWLQRYYPAPFGSIVRQFLPPSTAFPRLIANDQAGTKEPTPTPLPSLTTEQMNALQQIGSKGYHLLHGITGSGKTRVYIEATRRALEKGKSVIILTPEIGLTAQTVQSFQQALPQRLYLLHSRMTAAARRDTWYKIANASKPVIVLGPRSALFAPVHNLGLVVIDEAHDQAYKSETAPYYRAERVAARLAQLNQACLLSGSATPNIEDYYVASAKKRPIITLEQLAKQPVEGSENQIHIVDMCDKSLHTRSSILSNQLIEAVQKALSEQSQSLLFLNRRGTASAILCSDCGWQLVCSHCDLAMTYHGDSHQTRCHICGRTAPLPTSCLDCHGSDILLKTIGTKAVVDEVNRLFPQARVHRFDTDSPKPEQIENQLEMLQSGAIDIIIGTQMITKGLDLPKLSVVGILSADSSLLIPDYTANERTFQLLTQVLGRVGRGHRASQVVVQSYNPAHPTIVAATQQDWAGFYEQELRERQLFHFPPYVFLLRLTCLRASSASAEKTAMKLKKQIQKEHPGLIVEGPSPTFHPRESGKYKWQLIVKSPQRTKLTHLIECLPSGWQHDIDPANLL
ncbi:MAG: primosomal protein N' [Candidatus Saccharimonadales bacterium]